MQIVYIKSTNSIGVVIDQGFDTCEWYRTDVDGVREEDDLLFLTPEQVNNFPNAFIAESTKLCLTSLQ